MTGTVRKSLYFSERLWSNQIQKAVRRAAKNTGKSLKKGDKVVTVGGIYGVVDEIKEKTLLIVVDGNVKLRVDKNSVVKDFSETAQQ